MKYTVRNLARIQESILAKILDNKIARIQIDSCKYFSLSYKVIWQESMDFCKISLGESRWILTLGCKFLTLKYIVEADIDWHFCVRNSQPLALVLRGWIQWFLPQEQGFKMKNPLHILITSKWWFPQLSESFPESCVPCSSLLVLTQA